MRGRRGTIYEREDEKGRRTTTNTHRKMYGGRGGGRSAKDTITLFIHGI